MMLIGMDPSAGDIQSPLSLALVVETGRFPVNGNSWWNSPIGMFVTCGTYGDSMLIQSRVRAIELVAQLGG